MKHAKISTLEMTLDAGRLKRAVRLCRMVVNNRNTIPILGFLRIEVENGGSIWMTGTNLDCEVSVALSGYGHGRCTLPARTIGEFLSGADLGADDPVQFRADGERVAIEAGGMTLRVAPLPVEDWPGMKVNIEPGAKVAFPEGTLPWLINYVRPVISTEETRYYLNGICLTGNEEGVRAVATDGHRLASRQLRLDGGAPEFHQILPRGALPVLLAAAGKGEVDAEIWAGRAKDGDTPGVYQQARFSGADWIVKTKLIDGRFPDWTLVVPPREGQKTITIDGAKIRRFLSAAKAAQGTNRSIAVRIEQSETGAALTACTPDYGDVTMPVRAHWDEGFPAAIAFNRRYLAEAVAAGGPGDFTFGTASAGDPMRVAPDADDIFVVMPMRF